MKKVILILIIVHCASHIAQAQWFVQQSGTANTLRDIEFINQYTGWACGNGTILKTTNGGNNWISQTHPALDKPLFGIPPVDSNVVYCVGWFRTFLKTTDGGLNWIAIENGIPGDGNYFSVYFLNKLTGWASINWGFADSNGVRKTTDGGKSFSPISLTNDWPKDLYFKDSINGIGVNGSLIYRTINGGINWLSFQIAGQGDFYRVSFINDDTGFVASSGKVFKTKNFGITWDSVGYIPVSNSEITSIEFSNDSTGWAGTQYEMYKTINGGSNWLIQNSTLPGVIYNIYAYSDSLVWSCGNGGRIWHTKTGGDPITNINLISSILPSSFELKQNYPNPFNSITLMKFSIQAKANYKLELYDILGRLKGVLLNENLGPGEYKYTFNASGLTSGLYFYKLTSEKYSLTKSMIYMK